MVNNYPKGRQLYAPTILPPCPCYGTTDRIGRNLIQVACYTHAVESNTELTSRTSHHRSCPGQVQYLLTSPVGGSSAEVFPSQTWLRAMPTTIRPEVGGRPINLAYPCIEHICPYSSTLQNLYRPHDLMLFAVVPHTWSTA